MQKNTLHALCLTIGAFALVGAASFRSVPAQGRSDTPTVGIGTVQLRIGMAADTAIAALAKAGYRVVGGNCDPGPCEVWDGGAGDDSASIIASIQMKDGRVFVINQPWFDEVGRIPKGMQDQPSEAVQAIINAANAITSNASATCTVWHYNGASPEMNTRDLYITCPRGTIDITEATANYGHHVTTVSVNQVFPNVYPRGAK
ncbi:MAG: hypothetical protein EPN33_04985 [Acidobacteria bacterium]|nr:MAG: hypothetical protein EPN33_04985 [Acidobacteriota bacterium]